MNRDSGDQPMVDPHPQAEELALEPTLRPRVLRDFVGQQAVRSNLAVFVEAARRRATAMDHVLLTGPPGLGKTTLANILANELGATIRTTSGPAIDRTGDLAALLTHLEERDVLFIDEVHRLPRPVAEVLFPAMEDFKLDLVVGQGPTSRSVRLDLPPFTLVAATTRAGLLAAPLRDRFGIVERLDYYEPSDLAAIVQRAARQLQITIDSESAVELAQRARGTPRVAIRILRRISDFVVVQGLREIRVGSVREALTRLGIDQFGLDRLSRRYLRILHDVYSCGPVGLSTLAATLGEEPDSLEDACEPFLLQAGLLERTARGRVLTTRGKLHIGAVAE